MPGLVVNKGAAMSTGMAARMIQVCVCGGMGGGVLGFRVRKRGVCVLYIYINVPTRTAVAVRHLQPETERPLPPPQKNGQEQCQPILEAYKADPLQRFLYRGEDIHRCAAAVYSHEHGSMDPQPYDAPTDQQPKPPTPTHTQKHTNSPTLLACPPDLLDPVTYRESGAADFFARVEEAMATAPDSTKTFTVRYVLFGFLGGGICGGGR